MTDEYSEAENFAGTYFDLLIRETSGRIEVHVIGEIDLASRDALVSAAAYVRERVRARGGCTILVDASRAEFVDGSVIAFLMKLDGIAHESGHRVAVRNPRQAFRRLLEILELRQFLVSGLE